MTAQNTPRFSVIVPIYNVSKYLPECISSVLQQDFQNFELILVDDGSIDGSGEICDQFQQKDERIRVIHKSNGGVTSARNAGLDAAKGEYVLFFDGDDFVEADLLSRLEKIIGEFSPDLICFGYQTVNENMEVSEPHTDAMSEGLHTSAELKHIFNKLLYAPESKNFNQCSCILYSMCTKAFKKSLIDPIQAAIPTQIRRGEDAAAVMTAVCKCNSLYVIPFAGYNYRMQTSSVTHTFKPGDFSELLLLLTYFKKNVPWIPEDNVMQFAMTEIYYHTKDAVRGFDSYSAYRKYLDEIYTDEVKAIVTRFKLAKLIFARKLQMIAIKRRWWLLYWLIYAKRFLQE